MVSHKNYNLHVNEDFYVFLTSKLIACSIVGFTQSFACLLTKSAHIY
jgi:hypothetical protein